MWMQAKQQLDAALASASAARREAAEAVAAAEARAKAAAAAQAAAAEERAALAKRLDDLAAREVCRNTRMRLLRQSLQHRITRGTAGLGSVESYSNRAQCC